MNIFGQGLSTWGNWDSQNGAQGAETLRGHHAGGVNSAGTMAASASSGSLQAGQIFPGEILNITAKDVTILLDNQQMLNAKLGESIELNIGQRMFFEVKENQGEQILIRPMQDMNMNGQGMAAEKALSANGFALTERNLQIANRMLEAGMPLDKESMRKIMQQSVKVPEADVKQIVDMNRLGIPVNEMNVKQFSQYASHEHQLTQAMNQVLDSLETVVSNVTSRGTVEQLQSLNQQILDIFGWGEEAGTAAGAGSEAVSAVEIAQEMPDGESRTEGLTSNGGLPEEGMETVGEKGTESALSAAVSKSGGVEASMLDSLRVQLTDMGVPEETVQRLTDTSQDYGELLSNISGYLKQDGHVTEQGIRSFFQSDNYRKLLKKGIQEQWLMKPENMKEPKEIDRLYEKIYEQSGKLEESLDQSGHSNRQFSDQAQNMRDNIQFMQQLNQQFIFAQLPMKMNGQEANSELFVYANKKKLQQNAEGVRLLLHLDMPHLGSTDVLVTLRDKKLHARFTLEDQTSVSVIADNMVELSRRLEEKGFHFTNEVMKTEPKPEAPSPTLSEDRLVEEMLNQDLVTGVKRYTFDMRT